jgi:hypothetical protein
MGFPFAFVSMQHSPKVIFLGGRIVRLWLRPSERALTIEARPPWELVGLELDRNGIESL